MAAADGLSFPHLDAAGVRKPSNACWDRPFRRRDRLGRYHREPSSGRLGDCDVWERLDRRAAALESWASFANRPGMLAYRAAGALNRYEGDLHQRLADVVKIAEEIGADNLKLLADTSI